MRKNKKPPISQKQVWDKIAQDWYKFKTKPAEHTLEFLKARKGKILDLGCGSGRNFIKKEDIEIYAIDFSDNMIKLAKKHAKKNKINNINFYVSELTKLPFQNNFFDSAIANSSIHCIKGGVNRKKAVKELLRVLKPGAQAEISVWNKQAKRFKNASKEKYVHWRDRGTRYYYLFEPEEVYELFKSTGFKIKSKEEPQRNIIFTVEKLG